MGRAPEKFVKMHGLGNDFVIVDARDGDVDVTAEMARVIGDRQRGVGFDQFAYLTRADGVDAEVVFFNPDGSTAGACGNATRCIGRLLMEEAGTASVTLRTERGDLDCLDLGDGRYSANMGAPQLDWSEVPLAEAVDTIALPIEGAPGAVGMGNPHMVFDVEDVGTVDVAGRGAELEHHPLFPQRANVEFAEVIAPDHVRMRVWERGTGITQACGSGACATAVALARKGRTGRALRIDLDGGTLHVDWREDGVWLTGPAAFAFHGRFAPELLA